jgi:hypothetical protein
MKAPKRLHAQAPNCKKEKGWAAVEMTHVLIGKRIPRIVSVSNVFQPRMNTDEHR